MTTLERLTTILVRDYGADASQLSADTPLDSLGVDSLAAVELLWSVEETFGMTLPSDPPPMATLGDVVRFIDEHLAPEPVAEPADLARAR